MKRFRYFALAALVAFAACDEDTPVTPATGTVTGTVTADGAGIQGVTVTLAGPTSQSASTDASGAFTFSNVEAGNYAVTISGVPGDFACAATSQPVTVAVNQTATVAFTCSLVQTASISVFVTRGADPVPGAVVTITRTAPAPPGTPQTLQTGAQGQVSLTGLRAGTYQVQLTPPEGFDCPLTTQEVTLSVGQAQVVNFACAGGAPATVAIQSIVAVAHPTLAVGASVPANQLAGTLAVTVGIEEGDQDVSRLEILLCDAVVYTQDFGQGQVEEGMELATFNVTAIINTAEFDPETGEPVCLNQPTALVARVFTDQDPDEPAHTASLQGALVNPNAIHLTVTPDQTGVSTTGLLWWNGDLSIQALPVMYSGHGVASSTVRLEAESPSAVFADYLAGNSTTGTVTRTLTEAPFETTLSAENSILAAANANRGVGNVEDGSDLSISVTSLREDGQPGPARTIDEICDDGTVPALFGPECASGQPPVPIRLDNFAPVIGQFDQALRFSIAYPVTGWVGTDHEFDVTVGNAQAPGDETQVRAQDLGIGISGDAFFTYEAGETADEIEEVETPNDLDETLTNNVYLLRLTVEDDFGNMRSRWYDATPGGAGTATGGTRFGVDLEPPSIELVGGSLEDMDIIENAMMVFNEIVSTQYSDDRSGFPLNPVHTRIRREFPGLSTAAGCIVGVGTGCSIQGTTLNQPGTTGTFDFGTEPDDGYFRVEYRAMDAAGNVSPFIDLRVIRDTDAPSVGAPAVPATLEGGQQITFQAGAADNLDLDRADGYLVFGAVGSQNAFFQSSTSLGEWGPEEFTTSGTASSSYTFISSMQTGSGNAPTTATNHLFRVYDFGRNVTDGMSGAFPVSTPVRDFTDGDPDVAIDGGSETLASSEATVCWDTDDDGCTNPTSTTITFSLTGAGSAVVDGPLGNPFTRVTIYVGVDEDQDGTVDQAGGNDLWRAVGNASVSTTENPAGTVRTYTWSLSVTGAALGEAAGHADADGTDVSIRVVGYATDGTAFTVDNAAVELVTIDND